LHQKLKLTIIKQSTSFGGELWLLISFELGLGAPFHQSASRNSAHPYRRVDDYDYRELAQPTQQNSVIVK
jgi:hypothetical protein